MKYKFTNLETNVVEYVYIIDEIKENARIKCNFFHYSFPMTLCLYIKKLEVSPRTGNYCGFAGIPFSLERVDEFKLKSADSATIPKLYFREYTK